MNVPRALLRAAILAGTGVPHGRSGRAPHLYEALRFGLMDQAAAEKIPVSEDDYVVALRAVICALPSGPRARLRVASDTTSLLSLSRAVRQVSEGWYASHRGACAGLLRYAAEVALGGREPRHA